MEKSVCICGAGTMGRGIALTVAGSGVEAVLYDLNDDMISKAKRDIESELQGLSASAWDIRKAKAAPFLTTNT